MFIKDYPYARIVEEVRVLECRTLNFNPFTVIRELNEKFMGTYQAMTEEGPIQKFYLKPDKELVIQSPEGEEKGTWRIESVSPKTEKEKESGSILGITFKLGKTTQRYLCAFFHKEGVMMLIPSKNPVYSLDREDYDFGSCLFLVKESSRTGQLRCKTLEEVYDLIKSATMHKMENKEISKIVITKLDMVMFNVMLIISALPVILIVTRDIWSPWFGITATPPIWLYILCIVFLFGSAIGFIKWVHDYENKKIADFRQTHPNEIPDVTERWEEIKP